MNTTRLSRLERLVRGSAATVFAVTLAALSHVLGGGAAPTVAAVAATIIVVLPLSVALAGLRLSLLRVATLVLVSQGLFHASFAMIGSAAFSADARDNAMAPTAHALHSLDGLAVSSQMADALALSPTSSSVLMWLSHLGAALATIWLLRQGERAALTLMTLVVAALHALRSAAILPVVFGAWPALPAPLAPIAQPIQLRLSQRASRRGPPVFSA